MTDLEMDKFFLPNLVKKEEEDILSNEEVFKKLISADMNLCFSKDLKDKLDIFFNNCGGADVGGYKIVRLTLTDDMKQLMGELAISIVDKLKEPLLKDHISAICENQDKELQLRVAFNNFFDAIGENSKILLVLTNFYEHFAYIQPADINRLMAFLTKCKQCRLWICGDGEWYKEKPSVYKDLYRRLDPIYKPYYDGLKKGKTIPTVYISYKWKGFSMDAVDTLCDLFQLKQIYYKRDREDCRYGDNITDFMDEIRAGKFVVVVFSEAYLKSFNCVYELAGVLEHSDYMKRIFPIVIEESVREDNKYEELANYWEGQKSNKELIVKRIISQDKEVVVPLKKKVALIETYIHELNKLDEVLESLNAYSYEELVNWNFEPLLAKIHERLNTGL